MTVLLFCDKFKDLLPGLSIYLKRSIFTIAFELACVDPGSKACSRHSARCEVYQRLQFVDGLSFLRLQSAMQADSIQRLVPQGNASKETCAHLVVNIACERDKPPRIIKLTKAMLTVCSVSKLRRSSCGAHLVDGRSVTESA